MGSTAIAPGQPLFTTPLINPSSYVSLPWMPFFTSLQALVGGAPYLPVFIPIGANANGASDDTPTILNAYNQAVAAGGGTVYLGPGTYNILTPIALDGTVPVTFLGAGRSTKFLRGADMPAGKGVFDLAAATDITFVNFLVDGNVTTSVGVSYDQLAAIGYDPRNALLSNNSSFWLHDGCQRIAWSDVTITHTGGYSVFADAFNADITDLYFYRLQMENNRPNLFGFTSADCNYGAWTGGVLFHSNGLTGTATVRRAAFLSCSAKRMNGTAFWTGHLYGFSTMLYDITFDDIYGEDCGRDLIQLGATVGCRINGVRGHRIGYCTVDDTSPSVARWLPDQWAVAIDCGVCFDTTITNVDLTSVNGGMFDLDGMVRTTLSGFTGSNPLPGEPDYETDGIGLVGWANAATPGGPNAAYGINMSPAGYGPFAEGGHKVSSGILSNCSAGAIRMFASHDSAISDLRVFHPSVPNGAPIQIGNLGTTAPLQSSGNTITNVHFEYSPVAPAACVMENDSPVPFVASQINKILGNQVIDPTGMATEGQKSPTSSSIVTLTESIDFSTYHGTLQITDGFITGS